MRGQGQLYGMSDSPVFFMGKSDLRCMVEGSSFMRSDSCRLKGDVFWLSAGNPLKEPCLARASAGACLRGIAWGPRVDTERGGEDEGDGEPPVCCAEEFVPLVVFPATFTSVSAVRKGQQSDNNTPAAKKVQINPNGSFLPKRTDLFIKHKPNK